MKPTVIYIMNCHSCDKEFESNSWSETDAWICGCNNPDLHGNNDYRDKDGKSVEPDFNQYD